MIKLDDALVGVTLLAFDTTPIIYWVEAHPRCMAVMQEVLARLIRGQFAGTTSVVTLTEVLVQPLRRQDVRLQVRYRDILTRSQDLQMLPLNSAAAERAAELRARYALLTPDAFQIAVALEAGSQAFLTNDLRLKRVTELRVLVLDELEL